MLITLPDAVARERERLIEASLRQLQREGLTEFSVHAMGGYQEPERLTIPVLNVPMTPDILSHRSGDAVPVVACVEVSSDLGEDQCGRRWQGLAAWADAHQGRFRVFVHAEDQPRARDIAVLWHLDPACLQPIMTH